MCGIFGFIGKATNPKANYALLTSLGLKTEHRGKEATGIWGAQGGDDGQIIYHKEPVPATKFVETNIWRSLRKFDPNILLVHCREPSAGVGIPSVNRNNHPHVSKDYTVGMIHNGRVEEYYKYRDKFKEQIKSQCDSELLLHVFQTGEQVPDDDLLKRYPHLDQENFYRLFGIEQIYKKFEKTHMSVAVGERHEGTKRSLWLFRNEKRPMQVIDLRLSMGVIYFCSTMSIWREAVEATPEVKDIIPLNHDVVDLPVSYAYALSFNPEMQDEVYAAGEGVDPARVGKPIEGGWKSGWRIRKYGFGINWEEGAEEEETILLQSRALRNVKVYTGLNSNDEIQPAASVITVGEEVSDTIPDTVLDASEEVSLLEVDNVDSADCSEQNTVTYTHEPDESAEAGDKNQPENKIVDKNTDPYGTKSLDLDRLSTLSSEIQNLIRDLGVEVHNTAMEGSISPTDFSELIDGLEQIMGDVVGLRYSVIHK